MTVAAVSSVPVASNVAASAAVPTGSVVTYVLLSVLLCALAAWTAPDVLWNQDHAHILGLAESANFTGTWVKVGLQGSHVAEYGPLPANLQQLALAVGGDLFTAARLYVIVYFAVLAAGLWGLTRLLGVSVWYGLIFLATPVLWNLGRSMWDNTVLLPTTLLAVVCYGRFLKSSGRFWLTGAALCCGLAVLTHFMGIPVAGAIGLHALTRRGAAVLRAWVPVTLALSLLIAYATPYAARQLERFGHRMRVGRWVPPPPATMTAGLADDGIRTIPHLSAVPTHYPPRADYPARQSRARAAVFSLMGGHSFTGRAMLFEQPARPAALDAAARQAGRLSLIAVPLSLFGLAVMVWAVRPASGVPIERRALLAVLLLALPLFVAMNVFIRPAAFLHYYHGMIVVFFVSIAVGLRVLSAYRLGPVLAGVLVVCLAVQSVQQVTTTIRHATELPTLRALVSAARPMAAFKAAAIDTPSQVLALNPHVFTAVVGYYQRRERSPPTPVRAVSVMATGEGFGFAPGPLPAGSAYRIRPDRVRTYASGRSVEPSPDRPASQQSPPGS